MVAAPLPGEVAVILGIHGAGILAEPAKIPHLAHLSEHAIFHGSRQDRDTLAEWFRTGRANAETLPELMYFDLVPDPGDLEKARGIQKERLFDPELDQAILDREKPVALAEVTGLESSRSDRNDFLGKFAWSAFVQVALHGMTDVPLKAGTGTISIEDVQRFRDVTFSPRRAMITVVGDVDPEAEMTRWMARFGPATRRATNRSGLEALPESRPTLKPGFLKGSWDVASHQFFMAWPIPAPSDPLHPAITLLGQLLGVRMTMTSDVVKLTRRPAGVQADVGGLFVIQAPLRSKDDGEALAAAIGKLLDAIARDETLLRAAKPFKKNVRDSAGLGQVGYPPGIARKIMAHENQELWRMRATLAWDQSPEEYCARVDAVTPEDVAAAFKKHLAPEKATIVTITGKE